jgi:hypothetical protein
MAYKNNKSSMKKDDAFVSSFDKCTFFAAPVTKPHISNPSEIM